MRFDKVVGVLLLAIPFYSAGSCEQSINIAKICESTEDIVLDAATNTVCFNGSINHSTPAVVKQLAIDRTRKLNVVANSSGGIINPSIDIAEYLGKYDIFVSRECFSACSQFLFMQAENKYVIDEGIVAIHGGPTPVKKIIDLDFPDDAKIFLIREGLRFERFYHDRNIDMAILTTPPQRLHARLAAGEIIFWMPKPDEFEQYGVHNITYCKSGAGE